MTAAQQKGVVFSGGFVFSKNWVVISAHLVGQPEAKHTRVFTYKNGKWFHIDLFTIVRSLCGVGNPPKALYCMGRDGKINIQSSDAPTEEILPDAGVGKKKHGYLTRMRSIGEKLYVCGVAGQIYRRENSGWVHVDQGVLDPKGPPTALDLYCIDGTSASDIYAVGQKGLLWHFDGKSWTKLNSPTGSDINWIRCVAPGEVYLCGNSGSFYKGHLNQWKDFSFSRMKDEFWCAEVFGGKVYLAAREMLYVFDGSTVQPVETDLPVDPDGYHLHANDGVLWSFGFDHLCFFDGKKWTYVKHPDNE